MPFYDQKTNKVNVSEIDAAIYFKNVAGVKSPCSGTTQLKSVPLVAAV